MPSKTKPKDKPEKKPFEYVERDYVVVPRDVLTKYHVMSWADLYAMAQMAMDGLSITRWRWRCEDIRGGWEPDERFGEIAVFYEHHGLPYLLKQNWI